MRAQRLLSLVAMIAIAMLVLPAIVAAQMREPGGSIAVGTTATATVKAIDPAARTVTLETKEGEIRTIKCGEEVRNFDQIKVGDTVKAVAIEQLAIAVGKGATPNAGDEVLIVRAPKGEKPAIIITGSEQVTAKIDAVDTDARTVTLTGLEGQTKPIKLSPDVDMTGLSKGDEVTLRLTKGVALWVESPDDAARPAAERLTPGTVGSVFDEGTTTATVLAIDAKKRIVTLKGATGQIRQIHLGKEAVNFDKIEVGDKVRATLAEEIAVAVSKGGPAPSAGDNALVVRTMRDSKPGILIAESEQVTGKVQSVDIDKRTITLAEVDGKPKTIKAGSDVNLAELKAGDDITARVTQSLAIIVERP